MFFRKNTPISLPSSRDQDRDLGLERGLVSF
jgi:hypothetical protein